MRQKFKMDRRNFLKGTSATLALPFLESMGWASTAADKPFKPPVRIGFMYMPHGVVVNEFWPTSPESFLSAPPPALESLRPVLDQCLMMKGIAGIRYAPHFDAPHMLELSTWLTASLPDSATRDRVNIAISADQIAANHIGTTTFLPSLEIATMPQAGGGGVGQNGLNNAYSSHCSFRTPTQALPAEINPRNALKRLFGESTSAESLDRQMLDLVMGGALDLRKKLSLHDQDKLDEYLESVRSVERRIAAIESRQKEAALEKAGVSTRKRNDSDSPAIEITIPEGDKRSEYMQVMCDINVLAFQTDTTRVCTYIGEVTGEQTFPELGINMGHHGLTHHNHDPEMVRQLAAVTKFNIDQFAYMVKKMASLREGDGTLLDNCIMMWGSGLEDGNNHSRRNLPFILAGRGGGSLKTGQFLTDVHGNAGDLLTTILTCAGVPLDRPIGVGTKTLSEIMA
ncbi:MAG: DUF1552 domain-containing protein [Verrucomicrobiales bacterium]